MKKLCMFILIATYGTLCAHAQLLTDNPLLTLRDSAVQKLAAGYMRQPLAVGLSIGVYSNGNTHIYNYGESVKGSRVLINADQFFNLGSVAKTFVGTMLAEAVIEKRAELDDDIRRYLPGKYPNLQYADHPVTLVELANHTSGLPSAMRQFPAMTMDSVKKLSLTRQIDFFSRYDRDSVLKDLHQFKIDTIPGTKYHYNGNAMMVLIFLLEQIYHQPYENLVTHYLRTRLGMYDSRTRIPAPQLGRFIQGYNEVGAAVHWFDIDDHSKKDVNTNLYYAGGPSMNSTMNDMMKYLKAQVENTDPAIRLTHQLTWGPKPADFAIGLNWMYDLEDGVIDYYHSGHTGLGFNTICEFYPTEQLGFMIMVNDNISQDKVSQLENDLHKAFKK